jgi:hypothetical protein
MFIMPVSVPIHFRHAIPNDAFSFSLIGKTVLGFGANKTPAYVTHILTTK